MQEVMPLAAPIGLVLFAFLSLDRMRRRVGLGVVLPTVTFAYLAFVTWLNTSWANLGFIDYVQGHAQVFYTLGAIVLIASIQMRTQWRPILTGVCGAVLLTMTVPLYLWLRGTQTLFGEPLGTGTRFEGLLGRNSTAGVMAGVVVALMALLLVGREAGLRPPRILVWPALLVALVAFVESQSRGYSVGLAVAVLVLSGTFFVYSRRWKLVLTRIRESARMRRRAIAVALLIVIAAAFAVIPRYSETESVNAVQATQTRFTLFGRAIELWRTSVLLGLGVGTFEQAGIETHAAFPLGIASIRTDGEYLQEVVRFDPEGGQHTHNQFLQLLVEGGVLGLVLVMAAITLPAWRIWSTRRLHQSPAALASSLALVAMPVVSGMAAGRSLTSPSLILIPVAALWWLSAYVGMKIRSNGDMTDTDAMQVENRPMTA